MKTIIKEAVLTVLHEQRELSLINNPKRDSSDYYLSRKEAAEFLKISETTLWNLDKTQKLPAIRLNGKVLYLKSDLLNFHRQVA
ncbi:helix-turn-helix domain-containing protein [Tenacibaculum sp. 1B UA]|uniref:helix-turn-helix domain-containing protein n=1 Tax=Tenacibaculum sp. 1B UA TaxID=2922252 RepID=UPI002A23EC67|nr:helix-turn-helix domain-containing protein [Tenacibaculum sp. 1B UA]MDX8553933.1 helix-turn-helix domain-containing protein [Tenacibaculum sp. 1B UA]